jgi:cell division protein FtsN
MRRSSVAGAILLTFLLPTLAPRAGLAADAFYEHLLRRGIEAFGEQRHADAQRELRSAAFGLLAEPPLLAEALTFLALSQAATGDEDGLAESFVRLAVIEQRFGAYTQAELSAPERAAFVREVRRHAARLTQAGETAAAWAATLQAPGTTHAPSALPTAAPPPASQAPPAPAPSASPAAAPPFAAAEPAAIEPAVPQPVGGESSQAPAAPQSTSAATSSTVAAGIYVQVAALSRVEDAEGVRQRVMAMGFGADRVVIVPSASGVHRVRIGPFQTAADAKQALERLRPNAFPDAFRVR